MTINQSFKLSNGPEFGQYPSLDQGRIDLVVVERGNRIVLNMTTQSAIKLRDALNGVVNV